MSTSEGLPQINIKVLGRINGHDHSDENPALADAYQSDRPNERSIMFVDQNAHLGDKQRIHSVALIEFIWQFWMILCHSMSVFSRGQGPRRSSAERRRGPTLISARLRKIRKPISNVAWE
jgi:hypothetical protein